MATVTAPQDLEPDEVLKSYRYIRVALPLLLMFIFAAIVVEWRSTPSHCLRTSISAYYYTPARAVFTGALIAFGVCLVALRGRKPVEDTSLNLAGVFAFLVALVPTGPPDPADVAAGRECWSVPVDYANTRENVENNVVAFVLVSAVALLIGGALLRREQRRCAVAGDRFPPVWFIAYAVTWLLWAGCGGWLAVDPAGFIQVAHAIPAVLLFVCIAIVVAANVSRHRSGGAPVQLSAGGRSAWRPQIATYFIRHNPYPAILAAMAVSAAIVVGVHATTDWRHWLFALEAVELGLFAVFWTLQTLENWQRMNAGEPSIEAQQAT